MTQASASALIVAAAFLLPATVQAQGWLEDRARAEGPGIRLGNFELHPGLGAEIGWDSNVFYRDQAEVDSAILRVTPHLNLSTLGPERETEGDSQEAAPPVADFMVGVSAPIYIYFTDQARTNVEIEGDLKLHLLPQRVFSLVLTETISRHIRPFIEPGAADQNYGRIDNDAGAVINLQTDGGVLSGRAGYHFMLQIFEGDSFNYADSFIHRIDAAAAWRFLPSTAFLWDLRVDIRDYTALDRPAPTRLSDNQRLRTRVGINGAITNKLAVLAMIGYGANFFDDVMVSEADAPVAQAELRWQISPTSRLTIGYDRDFANSYAGGTHSRDRGHVDLQLLFGGAFLVGAGGSVAYLDFGPMLDRSGGALGVGGNTERTDIIVQGNLFAEYRFTDWFAINATFVYTGDFTDFEYEIPPPMMGLPAIIDPAGYQKFEVWGGLRVFY